MTYGRKIIVIVADGLPPLSFTRSEVVKTQIFVVQLSYGGKL